MSQFTQKYAIIQLFEDTPVGAQFFWKDWPLHATVADVFAIEWNVPTMIAELTETLKNHEQATSVTEDDRFFGDQGQVQAALLRKTDSLVKLHRDVIAVLEEGGWKPNNPQFAKDGFLPHSTVQKHARLNKGDEVKFNALSVIDFFPIKIRTNEKFLQQLKLANKDPYIGLVS